MVEIKRPGWGSKLTERQQKQYKDAKTAQHEAVKNTRASHSFNGGDTEKHDKAIKHELSSQDHVEKLREKYKPKGE